MVTRRAQCREAGFTLLETIVALVVLAMVSVALQHCLTTGWRNVQLVRQEQAVLLFAKAQLASAGNEGEIALGVEEGETAQGYSWKREVLPYDPDVGETSAVSQLQGYWVSVVVRWQEGPRRPERSISLATVKLARGG